MLRATFEPDMARDFLRGADPLRPLSPELSNQEASVQLFGTHSGTNGPPRQACPFS